MNSKLLFMPDVGKKVLLAKTDENAFAELVGKYSGHIKNAAHKTVGHYVSESDDEWSVALSAFHEAVKKYEPDRGSFLSFADVVIRRRLIDEVRKAGRNVEEVPLEIEHCQIAENQETDLRYEIEALSARLEPYGITFSDLVTASPKAEKTRKACALAIHVLTSEPALICSMRNSHTLPAKEIRKVCGIPQKILERHRKYIIAAAEIICSELPCLQEFVKTVREEGEHESNCLGM